ncbi:hypothetical protein ATO8_12856 [Roseivivax marinus]|uniref:TVP38/TMEM64 family membrane protein n=2 Tax=Roseivivax marinus TaxID=1379903 RepID=W4HI85_9RHOB|nr:hypothetical protein ATO8_12856 [Roseivivax marinus]
MPNAAADPESDEMSGPSRTRPGWLRHVPLALIVIVALIGTFALRDYLSFETLAENRERLLAFRNDNFAGLAAIFVAVYVAIVAFSLPGAAVASVTGGFLFGLWAGTVFNVLAATIGAVAIFLAARTGLGSALARRIEASEGTVKRLSKGLHENEISVLFLLRLVPVVPFFVANLVPAFVGVSLRNFVLTTALGIVPGAFVYTSVGVGVGEVFDRGETPDLSLLWEPQVILPLLGLAALAALPMVIKAVRGKSGV